MPSPSGEVKKVQCYHPTREYVNELGQKVRVNRPEVIHEKTYENGFIRLNTTTGEVQEFLH